VSEALLLAKMLLDFAFLGNSIRCGRMSWQVLNALSYTKADALDINHAIRRRSMKGCCLTLYKVVIFKNSLYNQNLNGLL